MEKFALLDFLKAFESLAPKQTAANANPNSANSSAASFGEKPEPAFQSAPAQTSAGAPAAPDVYETNVMANVLSRHEEIANRIKNKRSV